MRVALVALVLAACSAGGPVSVPAASAPVSAATVAPVTPAVLLLDAKALLDARTTVASGRDLPGLADLRREADMIVTAIPTTVTAKSAPPPSGDLHDYTSLSIYWWPDPSKADGLPYLQKDGRVNPESSDFAKYDASKLNRMVSSVETLSLAAYITGERAYADAAAKWLRTWFLDPKTRMNPNMTYAQIIPGRPQPRGTGIIDSRQLVRAVDGALLLAGTPSWTTADDDPLRSWFGALADWLTTSVNGQLEAKATNNHGIWYDAQLAAFAIYGGRDKIAKDTLGRVQNVRVTQQIAADGSIPQELTRTRSYHYSAFDLLAFTIAADLAPRAGADVWHGSGPGIRSAIDLLLRYLDDVKAWPHEEIGPVDLYTELAPVLTRATRAYPDAGYDAVLARLSAKATAAGTLRLRLGAFGSLGGAAAIPSPLVASAPDRSLSRATDP